MKRLKHYKLLFIFSLILWNCSSDSNGSDSPQSATVSITASQNMAAEPNTNGQFTINLSNSVDYAVQVSYTISGTATNGTDYSTLSNAVTIAANSTSATINISVINDSEAEDTETVTVTLNSTNQDNVTIGSQNAATVSIEDQAVTFTPENAASFMVNPNSTTETVALFYNLKMLADTGFAIGQQDAFSSFYNNVSGDSDMKKATGSDPALLGLDYMFITDDNNDGTVGNWFFQQEQMITANAVEAYNKGMIVAFSWHVREPYEGEEFYTANMTEFQSNNAFASILPGGANHEYYKQKLDKVADIANNLIGADGKKIPIIFRPFHEFDGGWFWWGAPYCSAGQFKTGWQFTVDYLKDVKGVNNMLYAFSPDNSYTAEATYLSRYPGDAYVDILGMDNYGDFNNQGQTGVTTANNKLKMVSDLAIEKTKIAALTETGYFVTPGSNNPISGFYANNLYNVLTNNNVKVSFMMFWSNSENTYCTPVPGTSAMTDFINFTDKPKALLENEIPNLYELP